MSDFKNTARPTTYLGVLFRSKSEACYAKWLTDNRIDWTYEPDAYAVGNYIPDFWVQYENSSGVNVTAIIEYKPSDVTDGYLSYFMSQCSQMQNTNLLSFCLLHCGSFFENTGTIQYVINQKSSEINRRGKWLGQIDNFYQRKLISRTRFDLRGRR